MENTLRCRFFASCAGVTVQHLQDGWVKSAKSRVCPSCQIAGAQDRPVCMPSHMQPEPGQRIDDAIGFCAVCCANCSLQQCFVHSKSPKALGWKACGSQRTWKCVSCIHEVQHENARCTFYAACSSETTDSLIASQGWCKIGRGHHCASCQQAIRDNTPLAVPRDMHDLEPGQRIDADAGFILLCCRACLSKVCFLHPKSPKAAGWHSQRGYALCGDCRELPADFNGPPEPFSPGAEHSIVSQKILKLCQALNQYPDLPDWVRDVRDSRLKLEGKYAPWKGMGDPSEQDGGNAAGSILVLAMLCPDRFGVPGGESLKIVGVPPPPGILEISSRRARSSVGPDNRRTNFVEGLLNYWQHHERHRAIRAQLLEAWLLLYRAVLLVDPFDSLTVAVMARRCLNVPDEVEDELWWTEAARRRMIANRELQSQQFIQKTKLEAQQRWCNLWAVRPVDGNASSGGAGSNCGAALCRRDSPPTAILGMPPLAQVGDEVVPPPPPLRFA